MARKNFERRENSNEIAKQPVYAIHELGKLTDKDVWELYSNFQKFNENARTEEPSIDIHVENGDPFKIEFMGDLHFGAVTTNIEAIRARVDYIINTPGVYVVFGGDVIDGMNKEYQDTIGASSVFANINQQIKAFKAAVYYPLLRAGKVLFAVTGFGGHEEWIRKASGLSPSKALYDDAIPYLENGGVASFYFEQSEKPDVNFMFAHDDGGANKPGSPFKGLQPALAANPELDGAGSQHNHATAAAAKIMRLAVKVSQPIDKEALKSVSLIKGGQRKSDNTDHKDPHTRRDFPGARVIQADGAVIFHQLTNGEYNTIPTFNDFDQSNPNSEYGHRGYEALQLLDQAEKTGTRQEIIEELAEAAGKASFNQIKSRSKHVKMEGDSTPHTEILTGKFAFENKSKKLFPILIMPFAETRASSKHMDKALIKSRVDEVANNPFAFAIFLREMFDKFMSTNENRDVHFEKFMQLLAPILTSDKTLGWLQSGSMLNAAWKKPIGKKDKLLPAKEINDRYNIPILDNYSTIVMGMPNGIEIAMLILDATSNNSKENIFYGPYMAMQNYSGRNIAVGGKSNQSGYMSYPDNQNNNDLKHILIPGWMSNKINIVNNDARENAPKNKAGIIINPLNGDVNIGLVESELNDLYDAIAIWSALAQSKEGLDHYLKQLK